MTASDFRATIAPAWPAGQVAFCGYCTWTSKSVASKHKAELLARKHVHAKHPRKDQP